MADQVSDIVARLTFTMDGDALDFAKTGRGVLVVEDRHANIPLPKGDKGDPGPEAALPNTICHIQHRGTTAPYAWPTRTTQPGYVMWVDGTNQEPTDPSDWVIGDIIFDAGTGV